MEETVICIPTKRRPPVKTLDTYTGIEYPVILICDPTVFDSHVSYYQDKPVKVVRGVYGMGAQSAMCYRLAFDHGFPRVFRMDDDHEPGTFYHIRKAADLSLNEVIEAANSVMDSLKVTLVGFVNSTNPRKMYEHGVRTYTHIAGPANLSISSGVPENLFMNPNLVRNEDTWRTCAHRAHDLLQGGKGENGRVGWIGSTWTKCYGHGTSILCTQKQLTESENMVMRRFPDMVEFRDDVTRVDERGLIVRKRRYLQTTKLEKLWA